jgi:gamma-glutamyl-gamma-aminobutyrate hydrolase PuuD
VQSLRTEQRQNAVVKIGLSARMLKQSTNEFGIGGKPLQYLEQNMANAVARSGALVFLIPSIGNTTELLSEHFNPQAYAQELDGLVLQGGADICPSEYGEEIVAGNVVTDPIRDRYEIELVRAFLSLKKPVLGVCRGMQLINVLMGGTLHQDIPKHYCPDARENLAHDLKMTENGYLAKIYGRTFGKVNSIHHQSVKKLGRDLIVEATAADDGTVEAIRYTGDSYLVGVQWHPEFHHASNGQSLDAEPLFGDFIKAAKLLKTAPEVSHLESSLRRQTMKIISLLAFVSLISGSLPTFAAGESKEKIKEAAVAVKDDAKELFGKVKEKTKAAAQKVKAKVHEKTK